jgi:hypothetical protein
MSHSTTKKSKASRVTDAIAADRDLKIFNDYYDGLGPFVKAYQVKQRLAERYKISPASIDKVLVKMRKQIRERESNHVA